MNDSRLPVYTLRIPEYQVETEPDHKTVGKMIDDQIKKHFLGQTVVVRGISSIAHPGKSVDELVAIIRELGTDRYDLERVGDRYENLQNKRIDFFAFRRKIMPKTQLFKDLSWGFYHGAKSIHGQPVRLNLLLIYDASQLKSVLHQYAGREDKKRDGFVFKNPENKASALLAIMKLDA